MASKNADHLISVPPPSIAGYDEALRSYFSSYRSNLMTFYTVNFATIHLFEKGSIAYPAIFNLVDVLSIFDLYFAKDDRVCTKSYKRFLRVANIVDDNRYIHQLTSSRLQADIMELRLAAPCPSGRKVVIPEQGYIYASLCDRLRHRSKFQEVCVSRFLPAFHKVIVEMQAANQTQTEIAECISSQTGRQVRQEDISRFLKKTALVQDQFEKRRQRAVMTLDMAEAYVQERIPNVSADKHGRKF